MERARAPSRTEIQNETRAESRAETRAEVTSRTSSRGSMVLDSSSNVKVVVRFRPLNARELAEENGGSCGPSAAQTSTQTTETTCRIQTDNSGYDFTFDRVFDSESSQEMIFNYSLHQTVEDVIKGFNGTVLAYGQTGAGKSYTMMGPSPESENRGAIPRIVEHLFTRLSDELAQADFSVTVSYMEVYNEMIKDLLDAKQTNLPLHDIPRHLGSGFYVKGLKKVQAQTAQDVYQVITQGLANRAVKSTLLNAESSRSHSILSLQVSQTRGSENRRGQLYLVDLAGSETAKKTGAEGVVLTEAKNINRSLSALGKVIHALTKARTTHVPYRDSKLTKILSESLGGNARTTLIVNCSPSAESASETISSLRFGTSAKAIKNAAHINSDSSGVGLTDAIKKELLAWRGGELVPESEWVDLAGSQPQPQPQPGPTRPSSSLSFSRRTSLPRLPERSDSRLSVASSTEAREDERRLVELQQQQLQEANKRYEQVVEALQKMEQFADGLREQIQAAAAADNNEVSAQRIHHLKYLVHTLDVERQRLTQANGKLRYNVLSKEKRVDGLRSHVDSLEAHVRLTTREGELTYAQFVDLMAGLRKRIDSFT